MAYSKAKLKSSGDKASPRFRPFYIGTFSNKCLLILALPYVSFEYVSINFTSFMGAPNSVNVVQYFP
jgi:hypothetical protein